MEVAASAIAFLQAAETCIKIANGFIDKVLAYRNANDRIAELVVRVEAIWLKTETQVTALRNVRGHNHARLQQFHEECLRRLIAKLCAASVEVETFVDAQIEDLNLMQLSVHARPVRKLRYSLLENHLKKTIQSLEDWHAVFDPSWFLLTLHSSKSIDFELEQQPSKTQGQQDISAVIAIRTVLQRTKSDTPTTRSVFRDESFISPEQEGLPHSNLTVAALQQTGNRVILDTTAYPESVDKGQTTCHVRDLARTLSCSQPSTLGLLQCIGVMKKLDTSGKISQYQFVFLYPSEHYTTTSSLRALLLRGPISLDAKYAIAKSLTRGILAVHSADFVHKSIRPDNILVFNDSNDQETKAYLVGFEQIRPAAASTSLIGDMLWERNLYRHPSRQGVRPEHIYIMQHDIYSLGVCLLEIGIWNSLVIPSVSPKPGKLLHIEGQLKMNNTLKAAWEIKKTLIHMARTFLPSLMGKAYTNVVLSCLTCLDPDATNMFASEKDLYDEDGILVGVVFIELILSKLGSISV